MGSGYAFAPLFTIGQGVLFLLLLSVLADGYMLYRIQWDSGIPSMLRSFFQWGRKCGESSGGKLLSVSRLCGGYR